MNNVWFIIYDTLQLGLKAGNRSWAYDLSEMVERSVAENFKLNYDFIKEEIRKKAIEKYGYLWW
jgi:hypothetical protein